jgi:Flp pilus assembly protein TadG
MATLPHNRGRLTGVAAGQDGTSLIEVALTMPLFLALLIAAAVFGVVCFDSIEVSSAARAGAQYGMQNHATALDLTGMQTAALKNGTNVTGMAAVAKNFCQCEASLGTNTSCSSVCASPQTIPIQFVQVNTSASVSPLFNNRWLPGVPVSFTLTGQAVMRVQQ